MANDWGAQNGFPASRAVLIGGGGLDLDHAIGADLDRVHGKHDVRVVQAFSGLKGEVVLVEG